MAIWPALTLPISDSLSGTTSCIEVRSLSTANAELEEPEAEEPPVALEDPVAAERPEEAAAEAPVALVPAPRIPIRWRSCALEALVVPLAETTFADLPESETIVPSSGAYSLVSASACSSLCTVSLSL